MLNKNVCSVNLNEKGQGTVEFALVTAAFLSITLCLGVLWNKAHDGAFIELAESSAPYQVNAQNPGIISDVFLY